MARFTWAADSVVELEANSSVHPIHADIRNLRGEANVEVANRQVDASGASGWIEADVDQLLTGNKLEDMALRKQIDAKQYPSVRYEVRSVEGGPDTSDTSDTSDTYKVTGTFTFHGTTREFTETARASLNGDKLIVEAEHTFDIQDFGVKPFKVLTMKIYPEVKLKVRLVGSPSGASAGSNWA